jgi:hypothetical protein
MDVEEATSEFIPGAKEDLPKNLDLCDLIKSRQVPAREALRIIRNRLGHPNPNVHLLTLQVSLLSLSPLSLSGQCDLHRQIAIGHGDKECGQAIPGRDGLEGLLRDNAGPVRPSNPDGL